MKKILIISLLSAITIPSNGQSKLSKALYPDDNWCKEPVDSIPISEMIRSMGHYWRLDSLGTNYVRRMFTIRFYEKKLKLDVDYDFVLKHFGPANREYSDKETLTLVYTVFDTGLVKDDFWSQSDMVLYMHFKFDRESKKLVLTLRS